MPAWRNCEASLSLVSEVNSRWPNRDKTSDGTIGDAAHASRTSDHNPSIVVAGTGVVRARDIDVDGIDAAWLAEHLRLLGAKRDRRLYPGGYVIFNERITTPDFSGWRRYTGTNPHTKHVHVSFTTNPAGFDDVGAWGISTAAPTIPALPEVSMPTVDDFWRAPVPDYYREDRRPMQAWDCMAWGTAHAANARDRATEAREEVRALREEVRAMRAELTGTNPLSAVQIDYAQLAAAMIAAIPRSAA